MIDVRGLFQQRVAGDDALLRLARLRFAEVGMPAEVYADHPDQLEHVLRYVPEHAALPMVHLGRRIDILDPGGVQTVQTFADRFAGRVHGLVVHDSAGMRDRLPAVVDALRTLGTPRPPSVGGGGRRPLVLLEYAAGLDPAWYAELATALLDVDLASCCIDIGHVGIRTARAALAAAAAAIPELGSTPLTPDDPRLPAVVAQVEAATRTALPAVTALIGELGGLGKPLHLHLHDGHPLRTGLPDHLGFLTHLPVPFDVGGRRSLAPMYGPAGLAAVLSTAEQSCAPGTLSATLEIHPVEGRLPLPERDRRALFGHWRDLTNAERTNHWLSVLSDNHTLTLTPR